MTPKSLFGSWSSVTAGISSPGFNVLQTWFRLQFLRCIILHFLVQETPFSQLLQFCEVFQGFLQTVICCLPKTDLQFLLCICFPTSLLNTASTGTGGWWAELEAEHGATAATPCQALQHLGLTLSWPLPPLSTLVPQDLTNIPWTFFLPWLPSGSFLSYALLSS